MCFVPTSTYHIHLPLLTHFSANPDIQPYRHVYLYGSPNCSATYANSIQGYLGKESLNLNAFPDNMEDVIFLRSYVHNASLVTGRWCILLMSFQSHICATPSTYQQITCLCLAQMQISSPQPPKRLRRSQARLAFHAALHALDSKSRSSMD